MRKSLNKKVKTWLASTMSAVAVLGLTFGLVFGLVDFSPKPAQPEQTQGATQPQNDKVWDSAHDAGDITLDFDWAGSGTSTDPWLISSAEELAGLSYKIFKNTTESAYISGNYYYQSKYFKQTCDIDVSAYWWQPIGTYYQRGTTTSMKRYFAGNYNGDGHTVSGIFTSSANSPAYNYRGLFGYIKTSGITATIKKLGIINSISQGYTYVGAIAGFSDYYNFEDCYSSATIKNRSQYSGGLTGRSYDANFYNCYFNGVIEGTNYVGGLTGSGGAAKFYNCYNAGSVAGSANLGGIIGQNYGECAFTNTYFGANCTLTSPAGTGGSTATRDTSLATNAKTLSWYQDSSKWNSSWPWDFENIWALDSALNNGYPVFVKPCILTISPNGGTWNGSLSNQSFTQQGGTTKSLPVPTREGYKFMGWRSESFVEGERIGNLGKSCLRTTFFTNDSPLNVYNYENNGNNVTHTRENASLSHSPYNSKILKISNTGNADPGLGGFYFATQAYADAEFIAIFEAKIPVGYDVQFKSNNCGGTNWAGIKNEWLTSRKGTGEWETYAHYIKCWPASTGGSYSTTNFFHLVGNAGTPDNPVNWYLTYASVYDCTGMGLNTDTIMSNLSQSTAYTFGAFNQTLVAMWEEDTWLCNAADSYAGGDGSVGNPYIIKTPQQLARLAQEGQTSAITGHYKLGANIDLAGHEWVPIGIAQTYRLQGTFDGNFYTIKNMKCTKFSVGDYAGLFATVLWDGIVKNLIMDNATVSVGDYAGVIAGLVDAISENCGIINCIVQNSNIRGTNAGGICGWSWNSRISSCLVKNTIINASSKGGAIYGQGGGGGTTILKDNGAYGITITAAKCDGGMYGEISGGTNYNMGNFVDYTINGTRQKIMYGDSTAWTGWGLAPSVNNDYPIQNSLFALGGFSTSQEVYDKLVSLGFHS